MDGRDLARDSPSRSESRGDSVLSGRGVGCLDAISRSDLGRACSPAQGACDGIARAAMSALSPRGRLVFQLHQKRIASPEVIAFLGQLLKHHPRRHVVVVMDQAPPHTSKKTMAYITSQRRLYVFYLPKYS